MGLGFQAEVGLQLRPGVRVEELPQVHQRVHQLALLVVALLLGGLLGGVLVRWRLAIVRRRFVAVRWFHAFPVGAFFNNASGS